MIEIKATLALHAKSSIAFDAGMELALFCPMCARDDRTIMFEPWGSRYGRCSSCGDYPEYEVSGPTVRVSRSIRLRRSVSALYFLHGVQDLIDRALPTWGRISLIAMCGYCGQHSNRQIQTNVHIPELTTCACAQPLYTQETANPSFSRRQMPTPRN